MAVLVIGTFAAVDNIQLAHADDNNGNDRKKPCNDQHSDSYKMLTKGYNTFYSAFPLKVFYHNEFLSLSSRTQNQAAHLVVYYFRSLGYITHNGRISLTYSVRQHCDEPDENFTLPETINHHKRSFMIWIFIRSLVPYLIFPRK